MHTMETNPAGFNTTQAALQELVKLRQEDQKNKAGWKIFWGAVYEALLGLPVLTAGILSGTVVGLIGGLAVAAPGAILIGIGIDNYSSRRK